MGVVINKTNIHFFSISSFQSSSILHEQIEKFNSNCNKAHILYAAAGVIRYTLRSHQGYTYATHWNVAEDIYQRYTV